METLVTAATGGMIAKYARKLYKKVLKRGVEVVMTTNIISEKKHAEQTLEILFSTMVQRTIGSARDFKCKQRGGLLILTFTIKTNQRQKH